MSHAGRKKKKKGGNVSWIIGVTQGRKDNPGEENS